MLSFSISERKERNTTIIFLFGPALCWAIANLDEQCKYHKIPKISPSKYKPPNSMQKKKTLQLNRPTEDKPMDVYAWKLPSNTK